ncbi:MAG: SH3 domain-containing protein [Firmicutes bacterium]|nr:SH3 domain-containing protein [Bacillota bacterium]
MKLYSKLYSKSCLLTLALILVLGACLPVARAAEGISISVDGLVVETDVPPFIDNNGRTMVPVRFVSEALGCGVIWNAENQRIKISRTGIWVELFIGQKTAYVNGTAVEMDTTAVLRKGRTMVPLRFLAETFGLEVDWNEARRTVAIKSSAPPEESSPEEPPPEGPSPEEDPNPRVGIVSGNSVNIRSGPGTDYDRLTQVNAGTRLTVLAEKGGWLQVEIPGGGKGWILGDYVDFQDPASPGNVNLGGNYTMPSGAASFALVMKDSVNVRTSPSQSSSVIAQVSSGQQLEVTGKQNNWLAVRLPDGRSGWIAGWLAAVGYDTQKKENPAPGGRPAELISRWSPGGQNAASDLPVLTDVEVEKTGDGILLKVSAASYLAFPSSFRLNNPSRLVFDFNANLGEDSAAPTLQANWGPVTSFRLGQFDEKTVRIVADLRDAASYALDRSSDGRTITIQIRSVDSSGKLIVIDPGHGALQTWGGSDPGAIGPSGLRERDVVRSISLQLGNILLNEGFTVIYTREGETGLSLEDRAWVAGISGAELLVSIHANASTDRSMSGTMTFYHAPWGSDREDQISQRKKLANYIQSELLNRLQRENKGVREANFAVLRNCPVPAVLVEVAFISNPEEEKLLADQVFQRRAAEAIALGIKRYLTAR